MIKKTAIIALTILFAALGISAQSMSGTWSYVPTFGSSYSYIVETPTRTFAVANGFLLAISDSETVYYSSQNKLSDADICKIQYNYDKGYLFIGYSNGNIDLLYDDDHVVNMPEIKDAVLTTSHEIGNVDFGSNRIAIATQFGIVIYDDDKHEVVESGIYNTPVKNVMIMGDELVLYEASGTVLRHSPLSARHPRLDSFEEYTDSNGDAFKMWDDIVRLTDNSFARHANTATNRPLMLYTIGDDDSITYTTLATNLSKSTDICVGKDMVAFANYAVLYIVNSDGTEKTVSVPTDYRGSKAFTTAGASSIWVGGTKGILNLDKSTSTATVTMDWFKPAASTVVRPAQLLWSADGEYLYISHIQASALLTSLSNGSKMHTCVLDRQGNITDLSVSTITSTHSMSVDTDDPTQFYMAAAYTGFNVLNHDGLVYKLTSDNVPFPSESSVDVAGASTIDPEGNLWLVAFVGYTTDDKPLIMLPAEKRLAGNWSALTPSDWQTHNAAFSGRDTNFGSQLIFSTVKPYAILTNSMWDGGYIVISHNGTYTDFTDDSYVDHIGLTDQSGASPGGSNAVYCVVEDKNGAFWFGSTAGVMVMSDPAEAMSGDYTLTRPLVARNDGTNYGDYLLSTETIYDIAVDHTNRKWIATAASGLYLVSADGTEILEHFTADNSPLPSDAVYAVTVDPQGSDVYIGTEYGLFIYSGNSSPAADDYSDVYVFPNPVRPEYTGNVMITGLMDSSLVKIADAAGNVIYTTTSEGGSAVWDVCNAAGKRVSSGVYFIMASQNDNGNTGVVSKIMIIN